MSSSTFASQGITGHGAREEAKRRTQTEKIALAGSGDFAFAGQETPHSHQPTPWSGILSPAAPYRNEARGGAPMAQHRAGSTARGLRMGINVILCRICRE